MSAHETMLRKFLNRAESRLPFLVPFNRRVGDQWLRLRSAEQVFTAIFRENKWGDPDSRSGKGSSLTHTQALRDALPSLLLELQCQSLLDLPCGDFHWMQYVPLDLEYIGGDVVAPLIAHNQRLYGNVRRRFVRLDLLRDPLPSADLVLCRDALVHFSYRDIFRGLDNLQASGSRYLLTTTYVGEERNHDIPTGRWRPLDLQRPPFDFPAPLLLIDERAPGEHMRKKHLGLWRMNQVPAAPLRPKW